MGFQLLLGIASTGFSIIEGLDTADFRSRVLLEFRQLRDYLRQIDQKIDRLLQQNKDILQSLDDLPEKFRQISDEVVRSQLLSERYNRFDTMSLMYRSIEDEEEWELLRAGYIQFVEDLNFTINNENRISYVPRLIPVSELAISIYGGSARNVVLELFSRKLSKLNTLYADFSTSIEVQLSELEILLNNRSYVAESNFGRNTQKVEDIAFTPVPNRTRTEHYTERVCREESDHDCCRGRTVCREEPRTRIANDHDFSNARDEHIQRIMQIISSLPKQLQKLATLRQVTALVENYFSMLSEDGNALDADLDVVLIDFSTEELIEKLAESREKLTHTKRRPECY